MEEAISNSIKELSIVIESEPELSQVTEDTLGTGNNAESNTAEKEHFGPLIVICKDCLLYTSPSPRDRQKSRMPSSA